MKKTLLTTLAFGLAMTLPSFATGVTFTTSGTFSTETPYTAGVSSLSGGGVTISFYGVPNFDNPLGAGNTPVTEELGTFMVSQVPPSSFTPPAGESFTLDINQTLPPGTGSITNNAFTGTVSQAGGFPRGATF